MPTKEDLECLNLELQREKLRCEIKVLRRTTPLVESLKLIGSLIVGIGGLVIAIAGFQFGEARALNAKADQRTAEDARKIAETAKNEAESAKRQIDADVISLRSEVVSRNGELAKVRADIIAASADLAAIQSRINGLKGISEDDRKKLEEALGRIDIDVRSSQPIIPKTTNKKLIDVIKSLFSETASQRGKAYDTLMGSYSRNQELVPTLLQFATSLPNNLNGIYNTLVVLSHLDQNQLRANASGIRTYALSIKSKGSRIGDRSQKLLNRLNKLAAP